MSGQTELDGLFPVELLPCEPQEQPISWIVEQPWEQVGASHVRIKANSSLRQSQDSRLRGKSDSRVKSQSDGCAHYNSSPNRDFRDFELYELLSDFGVVSDQLHSLLQRLVREHLLEVSPSREASFARSSENKNLSGWAANSSEKAVNFLNHLFGEDVEILRLVESDLPASRGESSEEGGLASCLG